MNPGNLNNRIVFYNHTKTADGYGGYTSSSSSIIASIWGDATIKSGKIEQTNGKRNRNKIAEVIVRKHDFDLVTNVEFTFTIDGEGNYRINDHYEMIEDEFVKLTGTFEE